MCPPTGTAETAALTPMTWTGERMIPFECDAATEVYHWQRYLYFRPWYLDAKIIDAASGEGYGSGYASVFAEQTQGFDISQEAVDHAKVRYPYAKFSQRDVCEVDYSQADLVISFETIEHLPEPLKFFQALKACRGRIVISTPSREMHSPGNELGDHPHNPFHTVEWSPEEFRDMVLDQFPDRQVRFLSQEDRWPGLIREGFDPSARYVIAIIGDGDLPKWPSIGLSMPTYDQADRAIEAISSMTKFYPGELRFAVVANGTPEAELAKLRTFQESFPHLMDLIEEPLNLGYGRGANAGLAHLKAVGAFDYYGVTNDDVLPSVACLSELAFAISALDEAGQRPGLVAPVSNEVSGLQKVDFGAFTTYPEMLYQAELLHRSSASSVTPLVQVRGLFFLLSPGCLEEVGGFDPIFGIGNFEDDDFNLRAKLAGYTQWKVDGAFLFHYGSSTFKSLKVDYSWLIERNKSLFIDKWRLAEFETWPRMAAAPAGVSLHVPLTAQPQKSEHVVNIGGNPVDLVYEATIYDLAGWIVTQLQGKPREARVAILDALQRVA